MASEIVLANEADRQQLFDLYDGNPDQAIPEATTANSTFPIVLPNAYSLDVRFLVTTIVNDPWEYRHSVKDAGRTQEQIDRRMNAAKIIAGSLNILKAGK